MTSFCVRTRIHKCQKRMKFVGVTIGSLGIAKIYQLPKIMSTAIEAPLLMLPSWIQILVIPQKETSSFHPLMSFLHTELYSELCIIEVDLSHLWNTSSVQTIGKSSGVYYKVSYELVMLFGGTEIEVQVCWKENVCSNFSL